MLRKGLHPKFVGDSHPARLFQGVWDHLSLFDEKEDTLLIYDGNRIVIPVDARKRVLELLHESHSGETKTLKRAQQDYYWPGMTADIKSKIRGCQSCQVIRRSNDTLPTVRLDRATEAMELVCIDLFQEGADHYLVMMDQYSGYPWCHMYNTWDSITTDEVTRVLLGWFYDFGFPTIIRSDNGPQFRQQFLYFCTKYGIKHQTSSPYHPRSNGQAEAGVKICKHLVKKCQAKGWTNFRAVMAAYRAMPRGDGVAPASLFFGRDLRGQLPVLPNKDKSSRAEMEAKREALRQAKDDSFNKEKTELECFEKGDFVRLQHPKTHEWYGTGQIMEVLYPGRSYVIREDFTGKEVRRNRRYLRWLSKYAHDADLEFVRQGSEAGRVFNKDGLAAGGFTPSLPLGSSPKRVTWDVESPEEDSFDDETWD